MSSQPLEHSALNDAASFELTEGCLGWINQYMRPVNAGKA